MLSKINSAAVVGLDAVPITVEVDNADFYFLSSANNLLTSMAATEINWSAPP